MVETFRIAAYTRISVDTELDKENTSIENQKSIIGDYCRAYFPTSTVDYFEDRDHSGYTFEQRPGYMELRPKLLTHEYDILIVKDLSRFSRRTGKGLSEFEDLAESGIRIVSIGESVDYPVKKDDWMKIKLYFFVNEMPVTDTSAKVSRVISNRQSKGEWICAVPYGYYFINTKNMVFDVDEEAAAVVKKVFELYLEGWGYKRIANWLTDRHIPTPRMREKAKAEAAGKEYRKAVKTQWSIVTVSEMLTNDFYIGTLRQRKHRRKTINGSDTVLDETEHIVFENNHTPIIDFRTFAAVRQQMKLRTKDNYRGIKKYDNTYSGFLFCGDCGEHMFSLSRKNLKEAYTCGSYHRRGLAGCTSHYIRADVLDGIVKNFIRKVRDNSQNMIKVLENQIKNEPQVAEDGMTAVIQLDDLIAEEKKQLKIAMSQKTRDLSRPNANVAVLEQTYDELISDITNRIEGLENQKYMAADNRNTMIRANRVAKTVIEIFNDILEKDKLDRTDLNLIIDRIIIYDDHIDVMLLDDVDEILSTGMITEEAANFKYDVENIEKAAFAAVQSSVHRSDKVFDVNVISYGDPLEIYTDREGEVIFKKYSPIGELNTFAMQYAETLYRTGELSVVITDRDGIIAYAGVPKKDYQDRRISPDMENIIENRSFYVYRRGDKKIGVTVDGSNEYYASCVMPIITEGDIIGSVASLRSGTEEYSSERSDTEEKLIRTAAMFLSKQLES